MARSGISATQVDRLGERLRAGPATETDLTLLDEYRRTFSAAYEEVSSVLARLRLEVTGRPANSTTSIVEKLRRESVRLTQMQDIAGCRAVVPNVVIQDEIVSEIGRVLQDVAIVDRRERPSHGYRAVHVIARVNGKSVEIQVRSRLQHLWAELSEKIADVVDPAIKYGGGPEDLRDILMDASRVIAEFESIEREVVAVHAEFSGHAASSIPDELRAQWDRVVSVREQGAASLEAILLALRSWHVQPRDQ